MAIITTQNMLSRPIIPETISVSAFLPPPSTLPFCSSVGLVSNADDLCRPLPRPPPAIGYVPWGSDALDDHLLAAGRGIIRPFGADLYV